MLLVIRANFTPSTSAFHTSATTTVIETKYISQIGGWDDTDVDYGIKKISNSELSVKKMGVDVAILVQLIVFMSTSRSWDRYWTGSCVSTRLYTRAMELQPLITCFPIRCQTHKDLLVSVQGLITNADHIDYSVSAGSYRD